MYQSRVDDCDRFALSTLYRLYMSSGSTGYTEKLINYVWKCYTWSSGGLKCRDVFLHAAVLRGDLSLRLLAPSFNTHRITERKMVPSSLRNESLVMETNYSRVLCCKFHVNFRLQLAFLNYIGANNAFHRTPCSDIWLPVSFICLVPSFVPVEVFVSLYHNW